MSRDGITMENILFSVLRFFLLGSFAGLALGMLARRLRKNNAGNV
jgi:hypothetical protein